LLTDYSVVKARGRLDHGGPVAGISPGQSGNTQARHWRNGDRIGNGNMTHSQAQSAPHDARRTILLWESIGVVLILLVGTCLHFLFAWTGYWRPAGLIAAVNESTWEHFKMAFWPSLLYSLVEYPFLRRTARNFWVGKCAAQLTMPLVTVVLFYGYTSITGRHYLSVDVVIFFLSVVAGQLVSYRVLTARKIAQRAIHRLAIVGLALLILAFSLLSYYPRRNFLFRHPETGEYGILDSYEDHDHDADH
jgi:hypothetical protein